MDKDDLRKRNISVVSGNLTRIFQSLNMSLLLLLQALNILYLEVLAFSTTSFHFALSWKQVNPFFDLHLTKVLYDVVLPSIFGSSSLSRG